MTDASALAALCDLARRYTYVRHEIADCGCHTVTLFVDGVKITEEDKDLGVCVENVLQKIGVPV